MVLLLGDDRVARGASPQSKSGQQIMKLDQSRNRHARRTETHARTGHRVQHPRRESDDDARRRLHMDKAPCPSIFAVVPSQAATKERMPAIVDDNFLPDMGRMTG